MKTLIFFFALIFSLITLHSILIPITNAIAFKRENKESWFLVILYIVDSCLWTLFYYLS